MQKQKNPKLPLSKKVAIIIEILEKDTKITYESLLAKGLSMNQCQQVLRKLEKTNFLNKRIPWTVSEKETKKADNRRIYYLLNPKITIENLRSTFLLEG